jgi:hypothetical protein
MWKTGDRVALTCDCVALVEWRLPHRPALHAVRIEQRGCGAAGHQVGRRILASSDTPRVVHE